MKKAVATIGSLFALWGALLISPTVAQNPQFPQTLPPNTVVGRLGIGPGPAQAIPIPFLQSSIPPSLSSPLGAPFTATPNYGASNTQNLFQAILGTSGAPNGVADAPFIVQKWSVGTTGVNVQNPAGYFATWKTGNGSNAHATALYAEAVDQGGWSGAGNVSYVEGIRSTSTVTGALGSAYGVVCSAGDNAAVTYTFIIACEGNPANNSGVDAPVTFNPNSAIIGFNAALFGANKADAGFFTTAAVGNTFRVGYMCGALSTDQSCFRSLASTVYGLDLALGSQSGAAVRVPNNTPISSRNAGNSADLALISLNASNQVVISSGAAQVVEPGSAWTAFTPSPSCGTATFTTNTARSKTMGKTTWITVDITFTALGTCTTGVAPAFSFTLPNQANNNTELTGREFVNNSAMIGCTLTANNSAVLSCVKQTTTLINWTGTDRLIVSGVYENQ